jgi:hypothetical protein
MIDDRMTGRQDDRQRILDKYMIKNIDVWLKKCFHWASIKGSTIVLRILSILSIRRTLGFQQAR